jgi:hypothetical protein
MGSAEHSVQGLFYSNQMSQSYVGFLYHQSLLSIRTCHWPTGFPPGLMTSGYVIKISPSKTKRKTKLEGKRDNGGVPASQRKHKVVRRLALSLRVSHYCPSWYPGITIHCNIAPWSGRPPGLRRFAGALFSVLCNSLAPGPCPNILLQLPESGDSYSEHPRQRYALLGGPS